MTPDMELLAKVIYEERASMPIRHRQHAHWVMDADMLRLVLELRDSHDMRLLWEPLASDQPLMLLGLPVEVRDGAEGIHLERDLSSWQCSSPDGPAPGWHERGCPHVDWTKAPADRYPGSGGFGVRL